MSPSGVVVVRFSVVSFAPQGTDLAVIGSTPELGDWQVHQACAMRCRLGSGRLQSEPDFHWVDVALPEDALHRQPQIEYKFIERSGSGIRWEDLGQAKNRYLRVDGEKAGEVHLLPVERFGEGASESDHTGRFYSGVKERCEISIRRATSQIFIGSCPRQKTHLDYLRSLGITAVINFQTEEDCTRNCVEGIGMESDAHAVKREYQRRGMHYIWMPTADMSTEGRTEMLPKASHMFGGLLRSGHVIYSHCNAGVGRSVSAVCGYLTFVLGLTDRQMQHVVASSRPAAFFDFEALHRARPRYEAEHGVRGPLESCHDDLLRQLSAAGPRPPGAGAVVVRFGLFSTAATGARFAIVGGCPTLGDWQTTHAVSLGCLESGNGSQPGLECHWADVAFPEAVLGQSFAVEYKFIQYMDQGPEWEEFGAPKNRRLELNGNKTGDLFCLLPARFGEASDDFKLRQEAMAVLDL